jgi:hypothetical protein
MRSVKFEQDGEAGDGELLRARAAAELAHVDAATIGRWAKSGRLVGASETLGGHRRYRRSGVLAAVAATPRPAPLPETRALVVSPLPAGVEPSPPVWATRRSWL